MEIKSITKSIRMTPRKLRRVIDAIRGKSAKDAQVMLKFMPYAAAKVVLKTLNSAIANAEHNNSQAVEDLFVAKVFADAGPTMKRFQPHAQGRAFQILKRTANLTLILSAKEGK